MDGSWTEWGVCSGVFGVCRIFATFRLFSPYAFPLALPPPFEEAEQTPFSPLPIGRNFVKKIESTSKFCEVFSRPQYVLNFDLSIKRRHRDIHVSQKTPKNPKHPSREASRSSVKVVLAFLGVFLTSSMISMSTL